MSNSGTAAAKDVADFQAADADLTAIAGLDSSTSGAIASDGSGWVKKTYAQFKTALGLTKSDVGLSNVDNVQQQPLDSDLTTIAGLTATTDNFMQAKSSAWASRTPAQVKTDLNLPADTVTDLSNKQPLDSDLTTIAGLTATTDNFLQAKSSAWASRTPAQVKTDLSLPSDTVTSLAAKADLASPALTGNPTAPTPSAADNDTSIATTAFVQGEIAAKAPLASPALTGNPTAPTPTAGDNDTSIATTAFVETRALAAVVDSIADADTTHAPSRNAVFDSLALKADLASPTFTGDPKAPTPAVGDNDTSIATTAFAMPRVPFNTSSFAEERSGDKVLSSSSTGVLVIPVTLPNATGTFVINWELDLFDAGNSATWYRLSGAATILGSTDGVAGWYATVQTLIPETAGTATLIRKPKVRYANTTGTTCYLILGDTTTAWNTMSVRVKSVVCTLGNATPNLVVGTPVVQGSLPTNSAIAEVTLLELPSVWRTSGTPEGTYADAPGALAQDYTNGVLYIKESGTSTTGWRQIPKIITATATLDFPNIVAQASNNVTFQSLTITVTGAAVGDAVILGPPSGIEAGLIWEGYVSATNTVTIRVGNPTSGAINPASATWRATVIK